MRKRKESKKHPHDEMKGFLQPLPTVKKEAFIMLVRTKTCRDLRAMKLEASKNDEDDLVMFLEAAAMLRTLVESGIPVHQL